MMNGMAWPLSLDEAIEFALNGEAILFTGSGFAHGAENVLGERFLDASSLARLLASKASIPDDCTLEEAAEAFEDILGIDALIQEIRSQFRTRSVADYHKSICSVPWHRIYTTNYDDIIEFSSKNCNQSVQTVTLSDDIYAIPKDGLLCVHLNGFVNLINRNNMSDQIKLTSTSYVTQSISASQWAGRFRDDLKMARAVFFIGYSLYDLDIKRLLLATEGLKDKSFFILGDDPSDALRRRISKYGHLVESTGEGFANLIAERGRSFIRKEAVGLDLLTVQEYTQSNATRATTDKDFADLLLLGRYATDLIGEAQRVSKTFYLSRGASRTALRMLDSDVKAVVLTGHLGNGKTLCLEGIKLLALEKNYRVFEVTDHSDSVAAEVYRIATTVERPLLVIDSYPAWLSVIKSYIESATPDARLIVTARSASHDAFAERLEIAVGSALGEIDLDQLNREELEWICDAFDEYGFWGEYSSKSRGAKLSFLSNTGKSQFQSILLKLLKSPDIGQRLRNIWSKQNISERHADILLSILIMSLANVNPTLDILGEIWEPSILNSSQFRRNLTVQEFLDFDSGKVKVRSPIAAQYLLQDVTDPSAVVAVMTQMARQAHDGRRRSRGLSELFRALVRFGDIQGIFSEKSRNIAVIRYYENIKNLSACREDPLFWLQYAIACLFIRDFDRAGRFLESAYSYADASPSFDTFQIDNHYARFLLDEAVERADASEAMVSFRRARALINSQAGDLSRDYPFRVAAEYKPFIDTFCSKLSINNLEEIAEAAHFILSQIAMMPYNRRISPKIHSSEANLLYVADRCDKELTARRST